MTNEKPEPVLYLAGGMQSGGTTIVSWCFLQRDDLTGILDTVHEIIPALDPRQGNTWCKFTVGAFGFADLVPHFEDAGFSVKPLLIARDVRAVWQSLCRKTYGLNGLTSEDPPLRMRFRRFLADWEHFDRSGRPIVRYEDFVSEPETTLKAACAGLGLAWQASMLAWDKNVSRDIADQLGWTNETFRNTRGRNLLETLKRPSDVRIDHIRADDLEWLDSTFADYNRKLGYPAKIEKPARGPGRAVPSFEVSRRAKWVAKHADVSRELREIAEMLRLSRFVQLAKSLPTIPGFRGVAKAASRIQGLAKTTDVRIDPPEL